MALLGRRLITPSPTFGHSSASIGVALIFLRVSVMNIVWIEDVLLDLAQCAENVSASELHDAILSAATIAKKTEKAELRNYETRSHRAATPTARMASNVIYPEKFFRTRPLRGGG